MQELSDHPRRGINRLRHRRRPVRVLLYLEDSLFAEIVRASLERLDQIDVRDASDGRDVGTAVDRGEVDLVVLDGDGEPAGVLRDIERLAAASGDVRIVVLVGDDDDELIGTMLDAGATSCVSKAVYPTDLGAVIRQAARGTVYHRPARTEITVEAALAGETPTERPEPLTPRERQILRLVSEGVGNKEIAQQLFVTEPTVKFHLSNVYRKLGVTNRMRASRVAAYFDLLAIVVALPDIAPF